MMITKLMITRMKKLMMKMMTKRVIMGRMKMMMTKRVIMGRSPSGTR